MELCEKTAEFNNLGATQTGELLYKSAPDTGMYFVEAGMVTAWTDAWWGRPDWGCEQLEQWRHVVFGQKHRSGG